jgi:tetratricopeptide (TPR) repeat protein
MVPSFQIHGDDDISFDLIENVKVDIELLADEEGNPFFRLSLPDRKMTLLESAPVSGNLFFRLEDLLQDRLLPSALLIINDDGTRNISSSVGWRLLDFTGAYDRALHFAAAREYEKASDELSAAVNANKKSEGFRVIWARYLLAAGKTSAAMSALLEELSLFPYSYRALFEQGRIERVGGNSDKAIEYLAKALEIYPNHLNSLLLAGEIYLKSDEEKACACLARAWRLSSALNPDKIHLILKNNGKASLLPELRTMASKVSLSTSFDNNLTAGTSVNNLSAGTSVNNTVVAPPLESLKETVFNEKYDESTEPHQPELVEARCSELTREGVLRLAVADIYRDGKVTAEEKLVFKNLCKTFPLPPEQIKQIVTEVKSGLKAAPDSGDFDCREFFKKIIEIVFGDSKVSKDEVSLVISLAGVLGMSREECTAIQQEVKASQKSQI